MLVTGLSPQDASHYSVDGDSVVADYNADYPRGADVVEVVYPQRSTGDLASLQTYAFPRPRLWLEQSLHDREDGDAVEGGVTMLSGDSEIVECVACGTTGIKARIQPTACPHETFDEGEGVVSVARGSGDRGTMEDA